MIMTMTMDGGNNSGGDGDTNSTGSFCHGMGMIMYMEGFQWTLKKSSTCLNFYFPSWTLDTTTKFVAAMVCVLVMGIVTEGVAKVRYSVSKKVATAVATVATQNHTTNEQRRNRDYRYYYYYYSYVQTGLQGLNALCAYLLMLVVMTYSLELVGCVILGLMIGYYVFDGDHYKLGSGSSGGSPCCNFLDHTTASHENNNTSSSATADEDGNGTTMTMLVEALLPTLAEDDNNDNGDTTIGGECESSVVRYGHNCCDN